MGAATIPALAVPGLVAAALLALAGAQKLVDPTMTVGALRALRLPASPAVVRVGSGVEVLIGTAAIVVGTSAVWALVAISYVAFGAFVVAAMRRGSMIGSCGCFGRDETPPHPVHVVVDLGLAAVAVAMAVGASGSLVDALADHPGPAVVIVGLAGLALALVYATFVDLPRTLVAGRAVRRAQPG